MKLLLTCRDACAALSMIEVSKILTENSVEHSILSQSPASEIIKENNFVSTHVDLPPSTDSNDHKATDLLNYAKSYLDSEKFDGIIIGLSTPGTGGLDEAFCKVSDSPTFLIQDFWGDLNLFFDNYPDHILACDEEAVNQNLKRHQKDSFNLGSIRHLKYKGLKYPTNLPTAPVFCWLDQPLEPKVAYFSLFTDWVTEVTHIPDSSIYLRPHPSSSSNHVNQLKKVLNDSSATFNFINDQPIEDTLLKSSVACSVISNGLVDAAYLNFFSEKMVCTPIYVLTSSDLNLQLSHFIDLDDLPLVKLGVALACKNQSSLKEHLTNFSQNSKSISLSSKRLPDPAKCKIALMSYLRKTIET